MIRELVTVTAVDPDHNRVSVVGADNVAETVNVQEPEMQRFLHTLKVGDRVELTYTEATAISVEPAGG